MRAVRYLDNDLGERIGRLDDDLITDAGPAGPDGFVPTPEAWAELESATGPRVRVADVRVLAPVSPRNLICVGTNYRSHADELAAPPPAVPVIFAKFTSSVIGPSDTVVVPAAESRPDYEAELALVVGHETRNVDRAGALAAIGGVTCINDVSGRHHQLDLPFAQWTLGKSFDTFAPIGPCITSPDQVDLAGLDVRCRLNGEIVQDFNTREMLHDCLEIVSYCSRFLTLRPGDVIATGTGGGVGQSRTPPRFLRDGDEIEVEIPGIGTLSNPVRAEGAADA